MENKKQAKATTNTSAKSTNSNAAKVVKTAVSNKKVPISPEVAEKQSITELVEKYQKINALVNKRSAFYDAIKKLDAFSFSSDTLQDNLSIKDAHGNSFLTSNSEVIEIVTDTIKEQIFLKIKSVESEITAAS